MRRPVLNRKMGKVAVSDVIGKASKNLILSAKKVPSGLKNVKKARKYFPETWMWTHAVIRYKLL